MERRNFLCTGILLVTGASGCLNNGDGVEVDSRFAGEECPSFWDTDETRCYHEMGTEPDVRLVPEREVGDPTEELMTLTLHNDSDSPVWGCPLSECWDLHKLIDGEWRSLTPFRVVPAVSVPLEAGDSHTWNLEMSNENVEPGNRLSPEPSDMAYTGPGTYAFQVDVSTEREVGGGDDIELVALLEIEGEPLELEPISVEDHDHEDGTVRVQMERDEEEGGRFVASVRKTEGVGENLDPMPTELAAQLHPIRNALAFFDRYDAEEVRLESDMSLRGWLNALRRAAEAYSTGYDIPLIEVTEDGPAEEYPYRFRFLHEGTYYKIVVEEMEGSNE
jgi:hypothetical protein